MRYLFRGLVRDTGRPVEGHVEAADDEAAFNALSQNGVVTESLNPDPKPLNLSDELPKAPQFADALESAFDSSSSQVDFDGLAERYHGKKVWVIDRDKIRRRVAQVVDAALALSHLHDEGSSQTRERVNSAIQAMFNDNTNLATERNADSIAGVRFNGGADRGFVPPPPPPPMPVSRVAPYLDPNGGHSNGGSHAGLEAQVNRMANLVKQAESALSAIKAAARNASFGGGGGGRRRGRTGSQIGGPHRWAVGGAERRPAGNLQEQSRPDAEPAAAAGAGRGRARTGGRRRRMRGAARPARSTGISCSTSSAQSVLSPPAVGRPPGRWAAGGLRLATVAAASPAPSQAGRRTAR